MGKGITCGSIGAIIKELGYSVAIKKLDPYLNIDPGTMNPREHGEVYVTDDGAETDLDIGTYERFAEINASKNNSTSSGKLLYNLLQRERAGEFLGKTVQLLPHFTNTIQNFITNDSDKYDFIICEIGGSVGDYEAGMIFSGLSPDGGLPEIVELSPEEHPFFIGAQFHPEFKSTPFKPHPLFLGLVKEALHR